MMSTNLKDTQSQNSLNNAGCYINLFNTKISGYPVKRNGLGISNSCFKQLCKVLYRDSRVGVFIFDTMAHSFTSYKCVYCNLDNALRLNQGELDTCFSSDADAMGTF